MAEPSPLQQLLQGEYDEALRCVKCGFCLSACPTYVETGLETASPRGRLALVQAVVEGRLPVAGGFAEAMDLCLGCRACESACPSGLQYGRVLEGVRAVVEQEVGSSRPLFERLLRWALFHLMLPRQGRLRLGARLLAFAQRTGLTKLLKRFLPTHMGELMDGLPPAPDGAVRTAWQQMLRPLPNGAGWVVPAARPSGARRVAFFPGCLMDALFLEINVATVRVLTHFGCDVLIPAEGSCCGALHAHGGEAEIARNLALQQVRSLQRLEETSGPVEAVITNSGGCGAHQQSFGHLLHDSGAAGQMAQRVRDLSQWLTEIGAAGWGPLSGFALYQESCHLSHGQKARQEPRNLLQQIPALKVRALQDNRCCGSAGFYNLVQPELSRTLLNAKVDEVRAHQPTLLVTGNPGCYLQLRTGIAGSDLAGQVEVLHLAQVLDRSISAAAQPH